MIVVDHGWNLPLTFSQETVKQVKANQEVILPELSKPNEFFVINK